MRIDEILGRQLRLYKDHSSYMRSIKCQIGVFMPPEDFLRLGSAPDQVDYLNATVEPLYKYNRYAKPGLSNLAPFLLIELSYENGKFVGQVTGHEGRHRALSLIKQKVKQMPVYLRLRPDDSAYDLIEKPNSYDDPVYYINKDHMPEIIYGQYTKEPVSTRDWNIFQDRWERYPRKPE